MGEQYWIALLTVGFFIVISAFVVAFGFIIYSAVQLKKMAVVLNDFCKLTDDKLKPVLEETEKTMKSIRVISDNLGLVTDDIKQLSGAASEMADNIRAVGAVIKDVSDEVSLRTQGVKAGIHAALGVLLKHHK